MMSETKDLSLGCRSCFERDGVISRDVVEHRSTNDRTGQEFTAFVCARCLEVGQEIRVTCRTFGHVAN
jgi:hypothetical protein